MVNGIVQISLIKAQKMNLYNQEKHIESDFWGNFDTGHEPALSDGTLDGTYIIKEVAPWTFNGEFCLILIQ